MKKSLFIVFLTILALSAQAQNKEIFADTASYEFKNRNELYQQVGLPDLRQSTNDFHFRHKHYQQIVDIWKNNDSIGGTVTNYVANTYGYKHKKERTLFETNPIDSSLTQKVYELVSNNAFPADIETDGLLNIYYRPMNFEFANNNHYWLQSYGADSKETEKYWRRRDSLLNLKNTYRQYEQLDSLQSLVETYRKQLNENFFKIQSFDKQLDSLLNLRESFTQFRNNLPRRGCNLYENEDGSSSGTCSRDYSFLLGYSGSARLPLGYDLWGIFYYIGNLKTKFEIEVEHRFNTNNSYDFSASFIKTLFNKKNLFGNLYYNYRQRHWNDIIHRNHTIAYWQGISVGKRGLRIGAGVDFLNNNNQEIGGIINIGYSLPYKLPSIGLQTSIFKQRIDYKINLSKLFHIQKIGQTFNANVFFERFMERNDIGFGLSIYL